MKAVIFDFDGTVANTLPVLIYGLQTVFKEFDDKDYSKEEIKGMFGPPEPVVINNHLISSKREDAVQLYFDQYEKHHNRLVEKNEEMDNLLATLKQRGLKLGIVTGKSQRSLSISLEKLQLKHFFDVMITGDDVEKAKPAPEGILTALSKLNIKPEEAMYIGDSNDDMKAGTAANVSTAAAQWLPEYQDSDYTVQPAAVYQQMSDLLDDLPQT